MLQKYGIELLTLRAEGQGDDLILEVPVMIVTDQPRLHPDVIALLGSDLGHLPPQHEHSHPPEYDL